MYTKENLINDIEKMGIKSTDTLLIHSSLKSVGEVEGKGETVLDSFMEVVNNGLLIFPTHTWGYIRNDGDIFDKNNSDSNVGALTNIARKNPNFIRSNHPTHSVCAYGKNAKEYIELDNNVSTPTDPKGCFGILKDMNAKILFLGAKLSKNTFVHSIEEFMNVPNRFTPNKFHFTSKDNEIVREYNVYRHYNKECPHISDNYEKLLPLMLKYGIATKGTIGDSESYLIDAKGCFDLVVRILTNDIDALSTNKDISNY